MRGLCVLFFILTSASIGASELPVVAVRSLSLAQAESLWQQANPQLRLARSAVAMTDADRLTADRGNNPQVSWGGTLFNPGTGNMPARHHLTIARYTEIDFLNYPDTERQALQHGSPILKRTLS